MATEQNETSTSAASSLASSPSTTSNELSNRDQTNLVADPPGLEYLDAIDQLMINYDQEIDRKVFTGWEGHKNRYVISNTLQQNLFYAVEKDNEIYICNCKCKEVTTNRPFEIAILNTFGQELIRVHRPYRCKCCCDFVQEIDVVSALDNKLLGSVVENWRLCSSQFEVKNSQGETVLYIEGPAARLAFMQTKFEILTLDRAHKIGFITRKFHGFVPEMFTNRLSDGFGFGIPMDLDVSIKAVLLAASFLIDVMYYEKNQKNLPQYH